MTADHLQAFIDFLSYGGTNPDGITSKPMSKGHMLLFSAVLQNSFRFAVFPKKLITFNPMQYVKLRGRKQETDIFLDSEEDTASIPTITHEQFQKLEEFLKAKDNPALLPVQIAYYTGLRIGEVCGLSPPGNGALRYRRWDGTFVLPLKLPLHLAVLPGV